MVSVCRRRQVNRAQLQAREFARDAVDGRAQVQANVGGHLVVAGATGVQLFAGDADQFGEPGLDIHVHIFQLDGPLEAARRNFLLHLVPGRLRFPQALPG